MTRARGRTEDLKGRNQWAGRGNALAQMPEITEARELRRERRRSVGRLGEEEGSGGGGRAEGQVVVIDCVTKHVLMTRGERERNGRRERDK